MEDVVGGRLGFSVFDQFRKNREGEVAKVLLELWLACWLVVHYPLETVADEAGDFAEHVYVFCYEAFVH